MIKKAPLVSIVMPTYNVSDFIEEAIISVLSQSYDNIELILVDDCSSDDTIEKISSFDDKRIILLQNEINLGPGVTRTRGLRAAKGDFIALLDADDRWYPDKLSAQVKFMQSTGAAVTYTRYDLIDEFGKTYMNSGALPEVATYHKLLRHCFIRTSSVVFDVKKTGRDVAFADIKKRQDFVFFLSLLKRVGEARLVDEMSCSYRIHAGSVSSSKLRNIRFQWAAYREHEKLNLTYCIYLMSHWFLRSGVLVLIRKTRGLAH